MFDPYFRAGLVMTFLLCIFSPFQQCGGAERIRREVIAIYDGSKSEDTDTEIFQFIQTPLEHLGYSVVYAPLSDPFPELKKEDDIQGIVLFDLSNLDEEKGGALVDYLTQALGLSKKILLFGSIPISNPTIGKSYRLERFFKELGLEFTGRWIVETYDHKISFKDPFMFGFEQEYEDALTPFPFVKALSKEIRILLSSQGEKEREPSVLAATGPFGGYIAPGYAVEYRYIGPKQVRKWLIDPFSFLSQAIGGDGLPKPDSTTLFGNRIFYSQIDGDGWNNVSEITLKGANWSLSSQVVLEKIFKKYGSLPFTVAPIAADLDKEWVGSTISIDIAKETFSLENIEPASHTYSHPFDWGFFEHYTKESEYPYLPKYPYGNFRDRTFFGTLLRYLGIDNEWSQKIMSSKFYYPRKPLQPGYVIPRAFANYPFDIHQEITGAIDLINTFCPQGKSIRILQWSGDCKPFKEALKLALDSGVQNINGGNTRFDSEFPSYAWVRPISRLLGSLRQPYASMSNENEYTQLWSTKFFGFNQLPSTWKNTNIPLRIRPVNLYFHTYSGEKQASLSALEENIRSVLLDDIIPIETSHFAEIVQSFYKVHIDRIGEGSYSIKDRGAVETIRFDRASLLGIDFSKSKGVVGQRHLHGSLYIFLDGSVQDNIVSVKEIEPTAFEPVEDVLYLTSSNFRVSDWRQVEGGGMEALFTGFGPLKLELKAESDGVFVAEYTMRDGEKRRVKAKSVQGRINFLCPMAGKNVVRVRVGKESVSSS